MITDIHKYIKVLFEIRRVLRPSVYFWSGGLRLGVAGCFAWTSLVMPLAEASAQERAFSPRSSRYDEFGNSPEDSAYFSPQRLRERMEKMDNWIQGQNARLSYLQGRVDPGATEEYSDQVRRYSVERFLVQGEMKDELEAKRAQTSRQLAQAGGFHFKQFKDGKREWYKNGKVQRVENEKIMQNGREMRRETLDMTYDARGNLAGYRTETRDDKGGVIGTSRWEGVYTEGRRKDARLLSFTENSWDALGNATRLDRTNIQWTADGKKTLSYTDSETDAYGKITKRDVSDSTYNTDGQLTSYKEVTLPHTGEMYTKIWSEGKYEKNSNDEWSLSSYKESVTDANGRRTERDWGQAKYDEKGRITNFSEKITNKAGKTSVRRWEKGRYDERGQLTGYEENVTGDEGRTSFKGWDGGRYDENGRVVGYEERTVDADGTAGWRRWNNGEYNAKNELIGFSEKIMDARGEFSDHTWFGKKYANGLLTQSFETTTDSRGRMVSKEWTGVYGEKDRVTSFIETNTDIAGQTSTREQNKLVYDTLGRLVSYNETNMDGFGIETRQVWTANEFDDEDRVIAYETQEKTPAGEQLRRRNNISHTASGRIAGYAEEVEVAGANGTLLITKTQWGDAVYGTSGELLSYHETTSNPVGETSSHKWRGKYDSLGRMVSYVDERAGAAGPPVTVRWSASSFDRLDHATNLTEIMESNGGVRERTWFGTYDKRGLVANSLETVRVSNGHTQSTKLNSAVYDKKGRLTDSDTSVRRSDMPDLVSEIKVAGQKYDDAGQVIGGSEVTHLTGRTPVGAIDLTITGGTANPTFFDGNLTGYEQTKITQGTDDKGQFVHIQDVTAVSLGQHGDRTDVTRHMAFNAQNQVVADKTSTNRQTRTVQDVQGRTLTARQETFENSTPDVVVNSQIKNTYGATGNLALSIEDATDALGVRTVRETENLSTDASGRTSGSRTTVTRPGMTVTEEVSEQSNILYDALGRSAGSHEDSTMTGPGLFTYSSVDRTVNYDGAGNVVMTCETGDRNGAAFDTTTTNETFNLSGQATAYREQGWSADIGVTDNRRSAITYNKYGQTETYTDEGVVGGQYRKNNHTVLDRDAYGRETRSLEEGINESGRYHYEGRTASFNTLGQATGRIETGWKASEGNYTLLQNNIHYDIAGRQLDYDQTKTGESKTLVSHWASKGYERNGSSLGYLETGTVTSGEEAGQAFTEDHSVGATNRFGQVMSHMTINVKTFTDGFTQTSTVNWSDGVYDSLGRLDGFFEDTTTVTTEQDGTTKTARNARERHHTHHADVSGEPNSAGASALAGFTSGYTETLYKNGDPEKAERVEVSNMLYDNNGLYYDSKTLRGKTDRFKDALRGLSLMLFGTEGPLSKTKQSLMRLFDLTEGLLADVGNWFEDVVEGGLELVGSLLGLPLGFATEEESERISSEKLELLTDALRKEIGTNQLQNLPMDLRPAVQSFGVMDEAPLLTQRTATVYDVQGRAVNWKEYSLTAASPTKSIYSEVKVTYKGASSQLASYDAKTIDGEKVLHTYRDQYSHDAQGRESYREVNFEGDDINLLPVTEGTETTAPQDPTVSSVASDWNTLTAPQRTALLDDIYNKKVEVLGKVDFFIPDLTEYDATGAVENMFITHVTRGIELFSLAESLNLAKETQQEELEAEKGIDNEIENRLTAQREIVAGFEGKVSQDDQNIDASQKAVDKQDVVLETVKAEEKTVRDQISGFKNLVKDVSQEIDAYRGKELDRKKVIPDIKILREAGVPKMSSREFVADGSRMKETTSYNWYSSWRINSSGQFIESVVCVEEKTLFKAATSHGSGSKKWESLTSTSKDVWSKDAKTICTINEDQKVLDFFNTKVARKRLLIPYFNQTPELKTLKSLFSDRVNFNAKILELNPVLHAKEEKTRLEQSIFDKFSDSLNSLESQREVDIRYVANAKTELDNLITSLANEKITKMAEVKAETARLIQALAGDLGANAVLSNGKTIHFSVSDWKSLLKGETVAQGGKQWDRVSLSANAFGKHSLNAEEHVARLATNVAGQTQTLSWKGTMVLAGQVVDGKNSGVLKQIATLAENASSQGPPNETPNIPGLTFNGDGHLSVTPPPTQTQDGFGRLTSQTSKTYSFSRWNGVSTANVVTQTTKDYRYDNLGNVIGYDRITSEPGKNPTHETLNSAKYDGQGRLRTSETTIKDESGTYTIRMTNDGYDANGRPINTQRVKTQGTSVTVSKEIGNPITDEWGHSLFNASENLSTTLDAWNKNSDFSSAVGQRSKGYTWNTAFNANGDVTDSFRVTQKALGQEGSHFIFESTHFAYNPSGPGTERSRLANSVSTVLEMGHDEKTGATLFKSYADENTVTKYSATGQALFQTTLHTENGVTKKTEDNKARTYDASGRLTETDTTTTDASGLKTRNHYRATAFDQAGQATSFERSSYQGDIKTFEEKVTGAVYDANGNLLGQNSKISEWDEEGKGLKSSTKTERGNTYNLFGQLTKSDTTITRSDSHGRIITDTKETKYEYDLSSRVVKTTVNGQEVIGDAIKPFNSVQEILSWDIFGRAARTRNTSQLDGLTTEKISLQDIQYDAKGRVISGRDMVHSMGDGYSKYTEETLDTNSTDFDSWGRATKYTQTLVDGGLRTTSMINVTFNEDGLVSSQTTNVLETSVNALVNHRVERTIKQSDMKYDALGNLVDYKKIVKDGDLETTYKALLLEFDRFGRPTTALERVTDTTGRDDIVGQVGSKYNSIGQLIESPESVTVKGTSNALDNDGNLAKVVAGIKAGAFRVDHDEEGKRLVESLGYQGVWVTQTTEPIRYDEQGRANHTYAVTNKVGWGTIDVPVTEVVFDQNADVHDGWKYSESLENRKKALQAQGFEITGSTFDWIGDTKHNRYCRATITYNKKVAAVVSSQETSEVNVTVFDALNRPMVQTVSTFMGANVTKNEQFLTYNNRGQVAEINGKVTEHGENADGGSLQRTYSQKQTFTYNTLGQSTKETTQTWGDSQAPNKIITNVIGDIKYGAKGERLSWEEATSTNDSTVTEVRRLSGVTYDGLGRLSTYTAVSYERIGGADKLKYVDVNMVNTYDYKGRLSRSVSQRTWGDKVDTTVLSPEEAQKAANAADKTGQAGGGIAGLDEGWTSGSAVVVTTYQYSENGTSISGMTVTAHGTGTNTNSEVQAQGIHLSYEQSNIKYDSVGRATSYHLKTTQIEHYESFKQVQKGLKRKVKSAWKTESVTTESDVQVLEFDGFGRQIHTVTTSQRNDVNKTWSQTDTVIKSFDEQGRAKDVKRTTDSRMELPKSSGKLAAKFQKSLLGKALKLSLIIAEATMGMPIVKSVTSSWGMAFLGMSGVQLLAGEKNWLGGQRIYSHNVVDQTVAYKTNGQVDEEKTKAQTRTLENDSYMQGKNFGDKATMVQDIVVAVVCVVIGFFCPPAGAALFMAYNSMRQGISTHDLGMFGKNSDRGEEGKKNRKRFWTDAAMVVVAWLAAPAKAGQGVKSAQQAAQMANTINQGVQAGNAVRQVSQLSRVMQAVSKFRNAVSGVVNFNRGTQILWRVGAQMAVAGINGADKKTFWQVAAVSLVDGAMGGGGGGGGGGSWQQAAFVGGGELLRQVGMNFGSEKQRTTWMITGGAIQGMSGGVKEGGGVSSSGMAYSGSSSVIKSLLLEEYSRSNGAEGASERERMRRGLVMTAVADLAGTITNKMSNAFRTAIEGNKFSMSTLFKAMGSALTVPLEMVGQLTQGFMALGTDLRDAVQSRFNVNSLAPQRNVVVQSVSVTDGGEPTTFVEMANGARVTCAVDKSGLPVFVKGSVLEFKNTRMSVESRDYLSGRFVSDGSRWQLVGEGVMVANNYKGLVREDGGYLPVTVRGRDGSVEALGVDWALVPVGMAMKVSDVATRLNGIGIVYAGTFVHAGNGRAVWEAGSIYQKEGDPRPTMVYSDRGKISLLNVVEIESDSFVVAVNQVGLGDGRALSLEKVRIPGRIENGVGVLTGGTVSGTGHLVGPFGEASGVVDVRAGKEGFELVGTLNGHAAWQEGKERVVTAGGPAGVMRELPAGQFTVMGKVGGYYHLLGEKFPVTEAGIDPFTTNTEFRVAEGAYLRKGPLDYRQNDSKGFFKVRSDGTIVAPYRAAVRDFTAHTLSVMGVDGNAESVVQFNNLWHPISGKTVGGMSEGVKPVERDGKKLWLIEGLGQHDIYVEMTPQERAGNGVAVRGLTTLERYAKKAMVFGLAYVSPIPVPEKSATVLVESSAHTTTTLAGNMLGLARNGVILLGIGTNQLGRELLGKSWETHVQDKVMRVFGWVAETLDSAKISMELINSDRLVGLGGAARDKQLSGGQVGAALTIGSFGDLAAGIVTISLLGGKSMDHYKKAYSGNVWLVTKAMVKDIVEPIYESFTYASSNGSKPAERGVVAKFYGLGEEAQPSAMDVYGPEVAMGLAVGNTLNVGLMTGSLLYGGLKGGAKTFNEEVGIAGKSYGRLNVAQRIGKATVSAGLEIGKEAVIQAVDQIVPGVAGKAVHLAERRTAAMKVLEFRQIEKNLTISDMAGVHVYDRVGNKVILEIHGKDGQTPNLPELARRLGESTKGQAIDVQIGFRDPEMAKSVSGNRELLNLFDENGIRNVRDLAKFERNVAVQRRGLYERVEKEYKGLAQVKEQAVVKLDGAIAEGRGRLAELTELRDNRGRMGDDAFIAKVKSLVGDWDSAGADPGSAGGLGGRETNQRPISEGVGRPGEEIRPRPEGPGGDRQTGDSSFDGYSELQKRAEARYGAEQARYGAEQALDYEISRTEIKIRELSQERSGLQQEISDFNGRAGRAGAGTRRYGERVERIDEHLQFLEERLKYLADPAVAKNLKITVTSAWGEGAVRTRGFLDGWAQDRKAQALDATYAPNPYTKIPKGNLISDFLAEHADVREIDESGLTQGLTPAESIVLVTVRENLAGAESLVRGIDPWRLKGEGNRFYQAVYFAEELWTGLLETIGEKGNPSHAAQFEFNVGKSRMLDLRNKRLAAEFGYEPEKWAGLSQAEVYRKTHEVHHRARMAGYDTIAYESTKNPGHTSYAVIDHFDTILKPSSEPIRAVDNSLLGAARQRLAAVLSDQSGKVLTPEKPTGSFFEDLFEKRNTEKPENVSPNVNTDGPPIVTPKEQTPHSEPSNDLARSETSVANPAHRTTPNGFDSKRTETTIKAPVPGGTNLQVPKTKTGVTVDNNGKGNVLKVDAPKSPRSDTPALNKSNPSRAGPAGPQAQAGAPIAKDSAIIKAGYTPLLPEVPQTLRHNLETGLRQIHPIAYEGTVYRNINTKFVADFDNISPSKNFRFRYNAEGEFGAGYYTELPEQSYSEIKAHGNDPFIGRSIVQAEVRAKLLDLTDRKNLNVLGINEKQITGPSYVVPIEIARQAREMGFEGIRAPQADGSGKANIILFTDKFSKESYVRKVQTLKFDKQQGQ